MIYKEKNNIYLSISVHIYYIYLYKKTCFHKTVSTKMLRAAIVSTKYWEPLLIIEHTIDNNCTAFRMISEGHVTLKTWRNDAENSDLYHRNKLHFKYIHIENSYFKV